MKRKEENRFPRLIPSLPFFPTIKILNYLDWEFIQKELRLISKSANEVYKNYIKWVKIDEEITAEVTNRFLDFYEISSTVLMKQRYDFSFSIAGVKDHPKLDSFINFLDTKKEGKLRIKNKESSERRSENWWSLTKIKPPFPMNLLSISLIGFKINLENFIEKLKWWKGIKELSLIEWTFFSYKDKKEVMANTKKNDGNMFKNIQKYTMLKIKDSEIVVLFLYEMVSLKTLIMVRWFNHKLIPNKIPQSLKEITISEWWLKDLDIMNIIKAKFLSTLRFIDFSFNLFSEKAAYLLKDKWEKYKRIIELRLKGYKWCNWHRVYYKR